MDLPRRILDGGGGDWERSVLSSATLDAPSPALRSRLRQDLGLAIGTGLAATAVTSKSLGAVGLKWSLVGLAIGIFGAAGLSSVSNLGNHSEVAVTRVARPASAPQQPRSPQATSTPVAAATEAEAAPEPAAAPVAAVASAIPTTPGRAPASSMAAPEPAPELPAPVAPPTGPVGSAQFASPTETELTAQLAAIRSVRAALASNQAARALREIDAYEHTYPAGLLLVEAAVLRIDADAALGNRAEVTRLGRAFLAKHPASPYARHVQSLLDKDQNP